MDPTSLLLADLKEKYAAQVVSPAFSRVYDDEDFGHMFAVLHEQLNQHFESINDRARSTRHYWADHSRRLIALIDGLRQDLRAMRSVGIDVTVEAGYQQAVDHCDKWLSSSGGSAVPEDFEQIALIRYVPIFIRSSMVVKMRKRPAGVNLKLEGEGSYAFVHSYIDPDYGIRFAVKRAKKGIGSRDLARFKREFEVMKRLSFPYVLEVYQYDDERDEYRMEFCDATLRSYIARRNSKLSSSARKRIALQFLYGINYIHSRNLLHRDISLQNVLLKVYRDGAVLVKLSDFGLVKDKLSAFTRTQTEMRGTIRDPLLHDFKQYEVRNEIYAIGWILSYIFTGRDAIASGQTALGTIAQKCVAHDLASRYQTVLDVITDVERLDASPDIDTA